MRSAAQATQSRTLRLVCFSCASTLLVVGILFAITESGFRIARAVRARSIASSDVEQSWLVYDEDLVFRPRHLPSAGPKGAAFRVLFLGDSLLGGRPHDNIVGRLDSIFSQDSNFRPSEWINTGVPGYTNYQELVYLKKYGLGLDPDLVGVVFCLNDVHKFEHNLRVVDGRILPGTSFWDPTSEAADATKGWILRLARHSLFLRWLGYKTALAGRAVQMYEAKGYDFEYRPDFSTAWQDPKWTMIKDQMTEMAELGKAHHFPVFLVVVPFAEQYRKDYLARDSNYVLKPQRILGSLMAGLNIPYLDLYPYLDKSCFGSDLIHLNEAGRQRAAQNIAEFLKCAQLLPVK